MKRLLRILAVLAVLLGIAFAVRAPVLTALGSYLVQAEQPVKADLALVLAGDSEGNRIRTGGDMVRQGFVPRTLVSGPAGIYGFYECDLAIPFAVKAGYPESYFLHFENRALSTTEEARMVIAELRRRGARHVLIVTSNYHTRRSGVNYRSLAPDMTFTVVAAPDPNFTPSTWWHTREGKKMFVYEWLKTAATWFGV